MAETKGRIDTKKLVQAAVFVAIIIVMTVVPYTGYINYLPLGIEITTLHIPVIIGACLLGAKYGALLGFVWGMTSFARAFMNPLWVVFTNPLVSVLPRILVGLIAGLVFAGLQKWAMKSEKGLGIKSVANAVAAAIIGTLTNTVLVLLAYYYFGGLIDSYAAWYETFKSILMTIISVNGLIELIAAIILVPAIYKAVTASRKKA